MEKLKSYSLENLIDSLKDINLQEGYIYIPDFKVTPEITEPYRSGYYCLGLVEEGNLVLESNLVKYEVNGPSIMFIEPSTIKNWKKPDKDYKAESILFSEQFLMEKLIQSNLFIAFAELSYTGIFIRMLPRVVLNQIKMLFTLIRENTAGEPYFQTEIVRGIVYSLVNIIGSLHIGENDGVNLKDKLSSRFRKALRIHAFKQREIQFYADLLNVHPKYLGRVIKTETGNTAGRWIQNQVILEAKILLRKNNLTIGQIADMLHFPDQSSFGKYFRKYSAMTPNQYRLSTLKAL